MELNNREIALLVWLGITFIFVLSKADIRPALGGVLKAFFQPSILFSLTAFGTYVLGCIYIAQETGLWEDDLANEAVLWFFVTGLVLFFSATRVAEQEDFFAPTARRFLTLGLLAEAFVNFVVLPLWAEFLLLPFLTLVVMMSVFTDGKEEYAQVKKLVDWVASIVGLALLAYVIISLITDPSQIDLGYVWRVLALPVWLTLACLPFIYAFGLYLAYNKVFNMLGFYAPDGASTWRQKLLLSRRFHLRARLVGEFKGPWQSKLARASTPDEARAVIGEFLES